MERRLCDGLEFFSPNSCLLFATDEDELFVAKVNDVGESLKLDRE